MVSFIEPVEVSLVLEGSDWVASLEGVKDLNAIYAFYLLRDGVRVGQRWYENNLVAKFSNDGVSGHYQARVFVKKNNIAESGDVIARFNSKPVFQNNTPYNLKRWERFPFFVHEFSSPWMEEKLTDGVYHFTEDGRYVDMLLSGMEKMEESNTVFVCFGGAVTSRTGTSAPFFSGVSIAKKLNAPMISVSDPTLSLSHQLGLGWYVGHEGFIDLPSYIARLLDSFVERTGARLIIFGGSGGGFASLLILSLLQTNNVSAFVWNPQTSIARYSLPSVRRFLEVAFPTNLSSSNIDKDLGATGVIFDLSSCVPLLSREKQIVYLQNSSDWHAQMHAEPFLSKFGASEKASKEVFLFNNYLAYWEGNWGEGHIPPSQEIIISGLGLLLSGKSPLDTVLELEKGMR